MMAQGNRLALTLIASASLLATAAVRGRAAEPLNAASVRETIGPRVCLVTADGPLGLPVAYATGFVLGGGKFVVTDLASLAQPGVKQATLRFEDGTTAVAKQFGMASPATGLVAVLVENARDDLAGLTLSTPAVGEDGIQAFVVGWKWGQELDLVSGRLTNGLPPAELAERLAVEAPKLTSDFLTFRSPTTEVATGAPLVDEAGGVVGVLVRMRGADGMVVVPSGMLRGALLSAERKLKPLSELPKPVWPVAVEPLAGKPTTPQAFAGAVRAIKNRSRCGKCRGSGKIVVRKVVSANRVGGMVRPVYRNETKTCTACNGDAVICEPGLYAHFAHMAEGAVRITLAPDTDKKVMEAAVTNGTAMLNALGKVRQRYRDELARQAAADLARADAEFPRGAVVYAQLLDPVERPEGVYTIVKPFQSSGLLAVRSDRLQRPLGEDEDSKAATPALGDWIVLAGVVEGRVALGQHQPLLVRSFGWVWGPSLGPRPKHAGPPRTTPENPPRPKPSKEPDFFGL